MSEPLVWGLLPKAQDNPQTIDDAISAAISAHESDPIAHLGSGESLDVHRTNDVLDHPAGAVLSDKASWTEIIFNEPFNILDPWNVVGSVDLTQYPQVQFDAVSSLGLTASIYVNVEVVENWLTADYDWQCQFAARGTNLDSVGSIWWGEGWNGGLDNGGIGFAYKDGTWYAVAGDFDSSHRVEITGVDFTAGHIYRIQNSVTDAKIYFFIDGTQVAALDFPSSQEGNDIGPSFGAHVLGSPYEMAFYIANLSYSRSVI